MYAYTPFGYPPRTSQERHQADADDILQREDDAAMRSRFEEGPPIMVLTRKAESLQRIIGECLEAKAEFQRTLPEQTLNEGGTNATAVVMAQARYIGHVIGTINAILAECRRLT